ncbi:hypothetical protein HAHE_42630 [Haloferula helveola]|uniref:VWFA domain-containing protein n=1 Tax=Haloferula helveola TaxID=490095 RepID=A0ABM7RFI9_9BACT|nr:hypothetical protein HAHE_42630 [Haloferula helveola]
MLISLLVLALMLLILAFIFLPSLMKEDVTIVSYAASQDQQEEIKQKTMSQVQRKPSSPSSSAAKVIAANVVSPTAIPVPDLEVTEPSIDFGNGDDFGEGWGNGSGDGMGGGGTTFFRQQVSAQRICYVIDYSASMSGQRDKLMRQELEKSVAQLSVGMQFQMIFFAGPAWVAGSEVKLNAKKTGVVKFDGDEYKWKSPGNAHVWDPVGKRLKPEWISGGPSSRNKALDHVRDTPLVWGTNWENPLDMALGMDPAPQIIFFMTDGSAGPDSMKTAKSIGAKAKSKGIIINTVAMMDPKAEAGMKEMAKRTGGQFSIVRPGGKVDIIPLK